LEGDDIVSLTSLVLPTIEVDHDVKTKKYGRFVISPLESGYGITLGNALRRVLLSSLAGAAVTSIRVTDVQHEFSDIPHAREDMTQLILNVKQIRVKMIDCESARLRLEVQGEGVVTAADIQLPPEVTIINPDLYLLALDSAEAQFEMELAVEQGRGYSPADERGRLSIGEIPVDAIFSPVRRVHYEVERTRVGQMTNYDKLVLEVWTDGTLRPEEALSQSAHMLLTHLRLIAGISEETLALEEARRDEPSIPSEVYEVPIEQLDLSVRVFNSLKRTGVTKVGEVLDMLDKGQEAMLAIRNFGEKSLTELKLQLVAKGYLTDESAPAEE
jgi:DNA-directed RNA polymerase subunit alpha